MKKPHLFLASDGTLYDTRTTPMRAIRENYRCTHQFIRDTHQLRATLRAGKASCYPLFLLTDDGGTLCFDCAREEYRQISQSIRGALTDGWRVIACDINYEDPNMLCAHCNEFIESAYADNEENDNGR